MIARAVIFSLTVNFILTETTDESVTVVNKYCKSLEHCEDDESYYMPNLKICLRGFISRKVDKSLSMEKSKGIRVNEQTNLGENYTEAAKLCNKYGGALLGLGDDGTSEKLRLAKDILGEAIVDLHKVNNVVDKSSTALTGLRLLNNKQLLTVEGRLLSMIPEIDISEANYNACHPFCTFHIYGSFPGKENGIFHVDKTSNNDILIICMKKDQVLQKETFKSLRDSGDSGEKLQNKSSNTFESLCYIAEEYTTKLFNTLFFNGAPRNDSVQVIAYLLMLALSAIVIEILSYANLPTVFVI